MKKIMWGIIALIFVVSCSKDGGHKGEYVAKVDNITITKEDVRAEIDVLPEMAKEFFSGPDGAARFVEELIKKELLYLEAKKRGIDKDKDFQRKVEEFKKLTLINRILEGEMEKVSKVTEKDVKEYYDKNKDEFMLNNQVRLSHIVVKTDDEAKKAYERLKNGEDFAKVASEMSVDKATAKVGGDLGSFKKGEMSAELEDIAFRLKRGEISAPVKLKDGVHIFKLTEAKGAVMEFEKVKGFVVQKITAERQKERFDKLIESLKKNYKVDINKEAVSKITFASAPSQK